MALVAFLALGVFIYNRLVGDKNRVLSAWSDIDVQLKRRHDLIPKLVDAVRHYAAYESATLAGGRHQRAHARRRGAHESEHSGDGGGGW
jgi:LemA protein